MHGVPAQRSDLTVQISSVKSLVFLFDAGTDSFIHGPDSRPASPFPDCVCNECATAELRPCC
jgi:hypothetical protein